MLVQGFSHLVGEEILELLFMIFIYICMPSYSLPFTVGVSCCTKR